MHSSASLVPSLVAPVNDDVTTWFLPDGAIARLGRGKVEDFSVSVDSVSLVVGSRLGLWWYALPSMDAIALWETDRGLVSAVAFSPDDTKLAIGNWDGMVKVWDVQHGICVAQMARMEEPVVISQLAFSPDGEYLAASGVRDDIVYVWQPENGAQIAKLSGDTVWQNCRSARPLTFSPDGRLLACASPDDTIRAADFISVWDVETCERIACLRGHTTLLYSLSFSPCGERIASGDRYGALREWDVASGQQVRRAFGDAKYPVIPSYSPLGNLLAAEVDANVITVWDVVRDEKLSVLEYSGNISSIHFSRGTHLVVATPLEFKVWTSDNPCTVSSISGHTHIPFSLTFSPNGKTLVSVGENNVMFWDIECKHLRATFTKNTGIHSFVYSSCGKMLAVGSRNTLVEVWAVGKPCELIAEFTSHRKQVRAAAFSLKGNRLATGDVKGKLYVWDVWRREKLCTLIGHTDAIMSVTFSPDGKLLASVAYNRNARLWDVERGEEITSLALTPLSDADKYSGSLYEIQRALKWLSSLASASNPPRSPLIRAMAFSPCGTVLAGGLWREIRLWDTITYETRMAILQPRGCGFPFTLAFSPCGRYLAAGAWWQGTEKVSIRLWAVANGENIATFWGHSTDVQSLAFSPDGTLLASGSYDGTLLLWDMTPYL